MADLAALDDKARRVKSLLSSYYGTDAGADGSSEADGSSGGQARVSGPRVPSIDTAAFDLDKFMAALLRGTRLDGLLSKHGEMASEIKRLDSDMQMLVYENYAKFITATDTIRSMKDNVESMGESMQSLLAAVDGIAAQSEAVNGKLASRRAGIEELNGIRGLLQKLQVLFDLPHRLRACVDTGALEIAVGYYAAAAPIMARFGAHAGGSFAAIRRESESVMAAVRTALTARLAAPASSASEARDAAAMLGRLGVGDAELQASWLAARTEALKASLTTAAHGATQAAAAASTPGSPPSPRAFVAHLNGAFLQDFVLTAAAFNDVFGAEGGLAAAAGGAKTTPLGEAARDLFARYFGVCRAALSPAGPPPPAADIVAALSSLAADVGRVARLVKSANLTDRVSEVVEKTLRSLVGAQLGGLESTVMDHLLATSGGVDTTQSPGTLRSRADAAATAWATGIASAVRELGAVVTDRAGAAVLGPLGDMHAGRVQAQCQQLVASLCGRCLALARLPPLTAGAACAVIPATAGDGYTSLMAGLPGVAAAVAPTSPSPVGQPPALHPGAALVLSRFCGYLAGPGTAAVTEALGLAFPNTGAAEAFASADLRPGLVSASSRLLQAAVAAAAAAAAAPVVATAGDARTATAPTGVRPCAVACAAALTSFDAQAAVLLDDNKAGGGGAVGRAAARAATGGAGAVGAGSRALERGVANLFSVKVAAFGAAEPNRASAAGAVTRLALRAIAESIRGSTLNSCAYQQLQVDAAALARGAGEDDGAGHAMLEEVLAAAAERCLDPQPLDAATVARLLGQR